MYEQSQRRRKKLIRISIGKPFPLPNRFLFCKAVKCCALQCDRQQSALASVWPAYSSITFLLCKIIMAAMCLGLLCMPAAVQAMSNAMVKDTDSLETAKAIKYIYPRSNATQMGWLTPGQSIQVLEFGPEYSMIYDDYSFAYVKTDTLAFLGEAPAAYDPPGAGIQEVLQIWQPSFAYVQRVPGVDKTPLYQAPFEGAAIIGSYYAGVTVEVLSFSDEWAQVEIATGNEMGQIGYMKQPCLSFYADPLHVPSDVPIVQVLATGQEGRINFIAQPDEGAEVIGQFIPGAYVELLGTVGAWGHVAHAGLSGFIQMTSLRPVGQKAILSEHWIRLPKKGYVIQKAPLDSDFDTTTDIYLFPTQDCSEKTEILGKYGKALEWITDLDGWTQAQGMEETDMLRGFIPATDLVYFPLSTGDSVTVGQGTYTISEALPVDSAFAAGNALPPGFYTFYMPESAFGSLTIDGANASFQRHFELQSNTSYTMYIPAGARVTIPAAGILSSMSTGEIVNEETGYTFSGNGRFLIGEQIPSNPFCGLYFIRLKPGETSGYFILSNLLWEEKTWNDDEETDVRSFPNRIDVLADDEYIVIPDGGYFIELYNVELECSFGNG